MSHPLVNVTINGSQVQAEKGRLLIDVAEEMGVFVPRFCYHPGMKSVAVCRMCLVQVEGQGKLVPACATPVDEGIVVNTVDPDAVDAQTGMLEFLLINHPLDCPICDRAGECPLQDQTYAHGPGSTRFVEPKRNFEKALEISDLVVLDRERCVLCWRCVRFSDEIAGDRFIQLVDRGYGTQILTFNDEPFDSYFSGNTIQICPVGALTSKPYRFVSRPWDLTAAPSVCTYCSVGCPVTNEVRADKVVRCQALPNAHVNDFWSCDKGRFGYHHVSAEDRLTAPLVRNSADEFEIASWATAFEAVRTKLAGKERIGVIAGGHLTTEDAFAISRLARKVLKTAHVDSRVQDDGAPYELALEFGNVAGSTATIDDLGAASTIVWAGPDPKEVLPVLYLRLRAAAIEHGVKLIVISPRRISLDGFASHVVRAAPGEEAGAIAALSADDGLGDNVVVCWGPSSPGRDESEIFASLLSFAEDRGAKVLVCPPHAGSQGMIDMGVHPSLGPGYQRVAEKGMGTRDMLAASAAGELDALFIFGADPIADFPDADLAEQALGGKTFVVSVELFPTETVARADVVFPSTAYAEREGTFTNLERRLQKLEPVVAAPGTAREPWKICAGLATVLGDKWDWNRFDDVWEALKKEVPTHADVDLDVLSKQAKLPEPHDESGFEQDPSHGTGAVAGPGGHYPKGYRSGAPFQTGQNWPLSWELRAFEAKQRPGVIPTRPGAPAQTPETAAPPIDGDPSSDEGSSMGSADEMEASSGGFVLYTGRQIYDEGTLVSHSKALHNLQRKPFVEMNDEDAKELQLADGDEVIVRAGTFEARVPLVVGDISRGAVFVPYDQRGLPANRLLGRGSGRVTVVKP